MTWKARFSHLAAVGVLVAAAAAAAASALPAPQTAPGDTLDPRTYDPDSRLFLVAHATGVQRYRCQADGTWLFTDPEATLYKSTGTSRPIGRHFLNVVTGRPVWQLVDGSSVEAARKAAVSGGAENVAWLLLQAVVSAAGSDGERLAGTTWVQRLNTTGGIAPPAPCAPGELTAVPYTADYFFWRQDPDDAALAAAPKIRTQATR